MKITRRKIFLIVWALSVIGGGWCIAKASGSIEFGVGTSLGLLAVSLGVPLMRALTEFSE